MCSTYRKIVWIVDSQRSNLSPWGNSYALPGTQTANETTGDNLEGIQTENGYIKHITTKSISWIKSRDQRVTHYPVISCTKPSPTRDNLKTWPGWPMWTMLPALRTGYSMRTSSKSVPNARPPRKSVDQEWDSSTTGWCRHSSTSTGSWWICFHCERWYPNRYPRCRRYNSPCLVACQSTAHLRTPVWCATHSIWWGSLDHISQNWPWPRRRRMQPEMQFPECRKIEWRPSWLTGLSC